MVNVKFTPNKQDMLTKFNEELEKIGVELTSYIGEDGHEIHLKLVKGDKSVYLGQRVLCKYLKDWLKIAKEM